jgi:hypothetical protein
MNIPFRPGGIRRMLPKQQPRQSKPKKPGQTRTRWIVKGRANGRCERCGGIGESIHHRQNEGQGGPWTPSNCVWLCGDGVRGCHGWATNYPLSAWLDGYHLKPNEDPTKRPIEHAVFGRVLLLDDGSYTAADRLDAYGEPCMTWTQPHCAGCFEHEYPGRRPARVTGADVETCCRCGKTNRDGIYARVDPSTVPFPKEGDD